MAIKTGFKKLDSLLGGGIPEKTSIVLMGPPKSAKTLFCTQYLFEGLANDQYVIYIITSKFPEEFVGELTKYNGVGSLIEKKLQKGLLKFVDCYSLHAGVEKERTLFIIRVNGPGALSEISIALSEIMKSIPAESTIRVVLDSVSILLLYNQPMSVAKFVQFVGSRVKARKANIIFVIEEGMHNERDVATLISLTDAIMHFKHEDKNNYIEVNGFGLQNEEIRYSVEKGKIVIE